MTVSWEKQQLVSECWNALPCSSLLHDQCKLDVGKSRCPKAAGVGSLALGQAWSPGSEFAAETAS